MIAGIAVDFFKCLAHGYRMGSIHLELRLATLFIFSLSVIVCILWFTLVGQDKVIDFKRQKIAFITALIVAALLSGYFIDFICD
jgi:hypothetical protein